MIVVINFIIGEDNNFFNKEYQKVIEAISIENNIEYKKYVFYDYDQDFFKIIKKDIPSKIYILDIEMNSYKGTEIANIIRKYDTDSLIIFITSHYDKYSKDMLENKYIFLKYIDKSGNYQQELREVIYEAIFNMNKKHILKIENKDVTYQINVKDILYLYSEDRKTHIVTSMYKATSSKPLSYYKNKLPYNFMYSHKSSIVNFEKISKIDRKKRIITFNNNLEINLLSKKYLKELYEKLETTC